MAEKIGSCLTCKHIIFEDNDGVRIPSHRCKAYPEGIPIEIQFGDVVHDKSYKNDGGVVYEKKEIKHRRYP